MIKGFNSQFSKLLKIAVRSTLKARIQVPLVRFNFGSKVSKKEQQRQEFLKEKSNVEVPTEVDLTKFEEANKKIIQDFDKELQTFKLGKLTPQTFTKVFVSAYNESTPISQLGQIIPVNATTISIAPYDPKLTNPIITALQKDKLNDFQVELQSEKILVTVPSGNTKEKKAKMLKMIKEAQDKFKDSLRQVRSQELKAQEKFAKFITKDAAKTISDEVERIYEGALSKLEEAYKRKEKEIQ